VPVLITVVKSFRAQVRRLTVGDDDVDLVTPVAADGAVTFTVTTLGIKTLGISA
jgi:hypothetical protein